MAINAHIPNFFRGDICTFHNTTIGRLEQIRSVITENTSSRFILVSLIQTLEELVADARLPP